MNKKIDFLINAFYYAFIGVLAFLAVKYLLKWFLPFIIAFAVAGISYYIVQKIGKGKINEKVSATLTVILIYAILGAVFVISVSGIILAIDKFSSKFPDIYNSAVLVFESVAGWTDKLISKISPQFANLSDMTLNEFMSRFENVITFLSEKSIIFAGKLIKSIPNIFTAFIITIISSVFISLNYKKILGFFQKNLPLKMRDILGHAKRFTAACVGKLIKAYSIIFLITFSQLTLAFFILRVEHPLTTALAVALVDLLPIVGLGIVIVPWIVASLFQKNFIMAIGLSITYLVIMVVRNVVEPKIVGTQMELPPIVTLICVYVGFKAIGVWGIFLIPISVIVLRDLFKSGLIKF